MHNLYANVCAREGLIQGDVKAPPDLLARFEAIDSATLSNAAKVIHDYGHWHSRNPDRTGASWKFANIADQVLNTRLGLVKTHRTGYSICDGVLRLSVSTRDWWASADLGPATVEFLELARLHAVGIGLHQPEGVKKLRESLASVVPAGFYPMNLETYMRETADCSDACPECGKRMVLQHGGAEWMDHNSGCGMSVPESEREGLGSGPARKARVELYWTKRRGAAKMADDMRAEKCVAMSMGLPAGVPAPDTSGTWNVSGVTGYFRWAPNEQGALVFDSFPLLGVRVIVDKGFTSIVPEGVDGSDKWPGVGVLGGVWADVDEHHVRLCAYMRLEGGDIVRLEVELDIGMRSRFVTYSPMTRNGAPYRGNIGQCTSWKTTQNAGAGDYRFTYSGGDHGSKGRSMHFWKDYESFRAWVKG